MTSSPERTIKPPEIVEVDRFEMVRLVTEVVPLSKPPPPPQLMQVLPTERLPTTLILPKKVEEAVVP